MVVPARRPPLAASMARASAPRARSALMEEDARACRRTRAPRRQSVPPAHARRSVLSEAAPASAWQVANPQTRFAERIRSLRARLASEEIQRQQAHRRSRAGDDGRDGGRVARALPQGARRAREEHGAARERLGEARHRHHRGEGRRGHHAHGRRRDPGPPREARARREDRRTSANVSRSTPRRGSRCCRPRPCRSRTDA